MSKKAVDIVLLPSQDVMYKIIELNGLLVEKFGGEIVLNGKNCLPHVSLAMGCIEEENIFVVGGILKTIAGEIAPRQLRATGIRVNTSSSGQNISSLEIEKTEKLQKLHEMVLNETESYLTSDVTEDMIYPSGPIAESSLRWIRQYRSKSSFDNFWPHITLGYGVMEDVEFPRRIEVSQLAACHLGNHCTCRKILTAVEL